MRPDELVALLAALGDAERVALAGWFAARSRPATLSDAAEATGHDLERARKIVTGLVATGLLVREGGGLRFDAAPLKAATESVRSGMPLRPHLARHPALTTVARNGVITHLPARPALQRELAQLAAEALPGSGPWSEAELGDALAPLTTDVALIRRLLVDEGLLERDASGTTYARADGGTAL